MGEIGHFRLKINIFEFFKICSLGFSQVMTGATEWAKATFLEFEGKFILCS